MRLWYFLRFDSPEYNAMSMKWEDEAATYIEKNFANNSHIEVIFHDKE